MLCSRQQFRIRVAVVATVVDTEHLPEVQVNLSLMYAASVAREGINNFPSRLIHPTAFIGIEPASKPGGKFVANVLDIFFTDVVLVNNILCL